MGIHTLGECARLPRDGFARRFGSACLAQLDRALGRGQEVFKPYQPAAVFNRHIDFGAELSAADDIQSGLQMLLQELRAFLVQRQLAARCVRIRFEYLAHPPGELILELRSAVHSTQQLDELLRLKFDRYQWIAPVIGIRMEALTEALQSIATTGLLAGERQPVSSLWLFERLRARLGETAVHGLEPLADHRPEHAWQSTELAAVTEPELPGVMSGRDRPLWLLHEPVRLSVHEERPVYRGELLACGDVERIESGWWDGAGVKRSYFSARDTRQHRWWIYQDEQGWYLHGVFG